MARILLVEDNEMNRDMLSRRLQRKGYDVVSLNDPQQVMQGLGIELCWAIVLLAFSQFLWVRGLRRHTAVGG